jgi:hypothetical protein
MAEGGDEQKAGVGAPAVSISCASQDAAATARICTALRQAGDRGVVRPERAAWRIRVAITGFGLRSARNRVFIVLVCLDVTPNPATDVPESFHRVGAVDTPAGSRDSTGVRRAYRTPELLI